MKIRLLTVGKIKEKYLRDAIAEYSKRLSRYCKLEILEAADEKTPDNAGEALELQIKQKEGDRLLNFISDSDYVIALDLQGEMYTSEEFARKIDRLGIQGISTIDFIIGGSLGLSEEVRKRADLKVSFSRMTFPHQLMRVIFLEQLYRSYRINRNEPYHK